MPTVRRVRVEIGGIVQGVGFRPFVYRLALRHELCGWVRNTPAGLELEAEGEEGAVTAFLRGMELEAPPLAVITSFSVYELPSAGTTGFAILASGGGESAAQVAPDGDVCPDCLRELFDPADRRYRYPFINCTNCGPRYSIITGIPYDRPLTTMAPFTMCPACRAEYEDPADRRFHAQPNACPACGPRLRLVDREGRELAASGDASLHAGVDLLHAGGILAVKGTGGYHLTVDACNGAAVAELRRRKARDEKPFALMARDLASAAVFALLDDTERRLLAGPERPIVLLRKRGQGTGVGDREISPLVAPTNGYFGVMLPSTPLHHLLLGEFAGAALVMTSGNLSDEPIAYRDAEACTRLAGIADAFLVHDREIQVRCDDSVLRVFQGNPLFLRRSRGYVPRAIRLPAPQQSVLAVGAELKGAVCLTRGGEGFMSQHIGDLQNAATLRSLEESVLHLERLLEITPEVVAHDLHPDYLSTLFAEGIADLPRVGVQHHHAHMAACMAENGLDGEVIGVVYDGTGFGVDGTVWGGEFLLGGYREVRRAGHLRSIPLPGGDAAVREPFRMALASLHDIYGDSLFDLQLPCLDEVPPADRPLFLGMLERGINTPLTSSCGRLFDAVAALIGVRSRSSYEGQAAMELEALAELGTSGWYYPYAAFGHDGRWGVDFRLMIEALVTDIRAGEARPAMARRFHDTVAAATADVCDKIRSASGVNRVVLSGGVFQNRLLTEGVSGRLREMGFELFVHRLVPPNDGGIALGQAVIAGQTLRTQSCN